jgi:hypothetical protein
MNRTHQLWHFARCPFGLERAEKKRSIAALCQTLPGRLTEQTTPLSGTNRRNCSRVQLPALTVKLRTLNA